MLAAVRPAKNVIQKDQAGTGDAVKVAVESLRREREPSCVVWRRPVDPHRNRQPACRARQAGARRRVGSGRAIRQDTVV